MSQYILLLRNQLGGESVKEVDGQAMMNRFIAWTEGLHRAGHLRAVEKLAPSGRMVRGQPSITVDGPYTEAKEAVVGLFILEAADYDEAVALARGCPSLAIGGTVEVRAFDAFPKPA